MRTFACWWSLERGRQTTVVLSTTTIFSAFAGYVFGLPHRLSTSLKTRDLEWRAWLFNVIFCFCVLRSKTSFLGFPKQLCKNKYRRRLQKRRIWGLVGFSIITLLSVEAFLWRVNIWWSYDENFLVPFLGATLYISPQLTYKVQKFWV